MSIAIDVDSSTAEITPHLRWSGGILQQAWIVTHCRAGVPHKRTTEWRDIPTEPAINPPPYSR
jgi:hypothetical protein